MRSRPRVPWSNRLVYLDILRVPFVDRENLPLDCLTVTGHKQIIQRFSFQIIQTVNVLVQDVVEDERHDRPRHTMTMRHTLAKAVYACTLIANPLQLQFVRVVSSTQCEAASGPRQADYVPGVIVRTGLSTSASRICTEPDLLPTAARNSLGVRTGVRLTWVIRMPGCNSASAAGLPSAT